MAIIDPIAIRCGLLPRELPGMTFAEINQVIEERMNQKESDRRFLDILNAVKCNVIAKCAGAKDIDASDFRCTRDKDDDGNDCPTPREYMDHLELIAKTYRGVDE